MKTTILIANAKFPLGELVITANADATLDAAEVREGIARHAAGDWGRVCPEDAALNEAALREGDRLLSVYGGGDGTFWVITEADRSVTTVLMPEDY